MPVEISGMQERLARFIAAQEGARSVSVTGLRQLAGGASREIWSLDAEYERDGAPVRLPLVLRRDPSASGVQSQRRDEFVLLRAAAAAGVPVPRVYWIADTPDVLGTPFFLMERIEGEAIPRRLLRDDEFAGARKVLPAQFGRILAQIHSIDVHDPELGFLTAPTDGQSPAASELNRYEQIYRAIAPDPHPVIELAFRELRMHMPRSTALAVVHGDYRLGNVMVGPDGVRAVLDWELAHLGDPMEDLGWLCVRAWRFGNDDRAVAGLGARSELFSAYEEGGGHPVDPLHVRYWELFGNLKWAIICIMQAKTHLDGLKNSVELASLGRRISETELELLNLIEGCAV
jgi:aminoglycoside phosphotransferase (APT) family kinase protein